MAAKQQPAGRSAASRPRWTWLDGELIAIVVGLLFSAVSLYFMAKGFIFLHEESRLETDGIPATATVIEMRSSSGSRGGSFYSPILGFTDAAGKEHVVDCQFYTLPYCEGQRIPIVYLPAEPEILRVEEDRMSPGWQNVLCGAIFLLVWGGCAALGFYAIRKKHRKKRRFLRKT